VIAPPTAKGMPAASNEAAERNVKAKTFLTAAEDGLAKTWVWTGRVWMNPPYAQPLCKNFVNRLLDEKYVTQWMTLTNNATETAWGQRLLKAAKVTCFHAGRIRFFDNDGCPEGAPLQGQMICYGGPDANIAEFVNRFRQFGTVLS